MSDLTRGVPPGPVAVAVASARTQNGAQPRTAPAAGTGPIPTEPPRYRTPTDVMRERRRREARRAEEAAAAARRRQEEEQDVGGRGGADVALAVGGTDDYRPAPAGAQLPPSQVYNIGGPPPGPGATSRRQENLPPIIAGPSRPGITTSRPVPAQGRGPVQPAAQRYDQWSVPADAPGPQPEQVPRTSQPPPLLTGPASAPAGPPPGAPSGPRAGAQSSGAPGRRGFPNAFERWEDLSGHWEGIVSSFIRRLQNNPDELAGKPLERQMARQIEDLSAAGANLFHAVVELQRLRASSERKFQRWFFEKRNELEQAQERATELERQVRAEREARTYRSTSMEQIRTEKSRADELVKEMRRELQISKEEARRAWEELGRREQEERERTIALRSGEATLIGGVQVVPMQGLPSRQVSAAQRSHTQDGEAAGPSLSLPLPQSVSIAQRPPSRSHTTTSTSLDSPGEESRQFTYHRTAVGSPPVPDLFVEAGRPRQQPQSQLHHEPDTQFYSAPPRPTQPPTSAAAIAAARAASTTGPSPVRASTDPRYAQPALSLAPMPGTLSLPPRTATGGTEQSYGVASTASGASEEEYHINPDGSYIRDTHGRRIPYHHPLGPGPGPSGLAVQLSDDEQEPLSDDEDDDGYHEQEPMRGTQSRRSDQLPPVSGPLAPIPQGQPLEPDYEGAGYDPPIVTQATAQWQTLQPRHQHPTRLSDILEEQTARTSPSRTSYVSGAAVSPGEGLGGPPSSGPAYGR